MILTETELTDALIARHGESAQKKLHAATVGIAGLGGLGSNVAVHLARLGVGHLILADFDCVDITNLNRQHYTMHDLGKPKTEALIAQLREINPYLQYDAHQMRVTPENIPTLFAGCTVICEAFDRPDQKAMLTETVLTKLPEIPLVAASGMAGYASGNLIHTTHRFGNFYLCGDETSGLEQGLPLAAPRVALCAAHEATAIMRLILGEVS